MCIAWVHKLRPERCHVLHLGQVMKSSGEECADLQTAVGHLLRGTCCAARSCNRRLNSSEHSELTSLEAFAAEILVGSY